MINNVPLFTISFKWTRVLISAIAVVDFFGWIDRFANLSFVVAGDYRFNVAHTAIAQLKSVPVKDFVKLVGCYILSLLTQKYGSNIGLYRDDGLSAFNKTPQEIERIKKDLCKIFRDNDLKPT